MLYVMLGTIHHHLTKEQRMAAYARRAEWSFPKGIEVKGEYWSASAPQILCVLETESYDPIQAITMEWSDFMEMRFTPCTTPEAGLKAAQKLGK